MSSCPPIISFVIPHRNHGAFLDGCIQSCLAATSLPCEVICIDDSSTDGSDAVLRDWPQRDGRVKAFFNASNQGVEATLNYGLKQAVGEFVVFRAADDFSLPGFLDEALGLLKLYPKAEYCIGDTCFFSTDGSDGRLEQAGIGDSPRFVTSEDWNGTFGGNGLSVSAALIRRNSASSIGGMDVGLRWLSDWTMLVELGFRGGMIYLPRASCSMKIHGGSYNSVNAANLDQNKEVLYKMLCRFRDQGQYFVNQLAASRILGFFRSGMSAFSGSDLSEWDEELLQLSNSVFEAVPAVRDECGMPRALEDFLNENREVICGASRIAIYGSGGHTRILLKKWRKLSLPEPIAILTSGEPEQMDLDGVPIRMASAFSANDFNVIVASSKSYEAQIAESAFLAFPEANILRAWS